MPLATGVMFTHELLLQAKWLVQPESAIAGGVVGGAGDERRFE